MTSPSNDNPAPKSARNAAPCPICNKAVTADYAPFCSKRCADIDLHRWLFGGYAIPAVEEDGGPEDEDEA